MAPKNDKASTDRHFARLRTAGAPLPTITKQNASEASRNGPLTATMGECATTLPKGRVTTPPRASDPISAIMIENRSPDAVLGKVKTNHGVQIVPIGKVADSPLNYLAFRGAEANRISPIIYGAATRFRDDLQALARTGSNTAAILDHMMTAPKLTPEDRRMLAEGVQFIKSAGETLTKADPTGRMIAAAFRVRRFTQRLDPVEQSVLTDLLINERTIGQIGQRWGWPSEAASTVTRLALAKLTKLSMEIDAEFCAWVASYREETDEPFPDLDRKKVRKGS